MSALAALPLGAIRATIADYVSTLINVYTFLIFAYILSSLYQSFGGRIPYNRPLIALLDFLRQVCDPYLGLFRRFIPPLGAIDLSPLVGILVLTIGGGLIVRLISG
ncbi:MAG: YggT family protein [Actinomycetes bacterium]